MRRDPAADMHTDRAYFPRLLSTRRRARFPAALNAENRQRIDNGLFHGPDIRDDIALPFPQIEDRIADNLTGAVIRDVAAAVGLVKADTGRAEITSSRSEQILHVPIPPESDDMRMLDEQKLIGNLSPLASVDELALHCERFGNSRRVRRSRTSHLTH